MEAVLATEPIGRLRGIFRGAGCDERDGASGSNVRLHRGPRSRLGGKCKGGQHGQALGRSRGGLSTKMHLKTDFGGLPIACHLTGGEVSDSRNFETLLDIGPDINPRAALGDKGYDSKSNRDAARQRMSGNPVSIQHQSHTDLHSESSLQRPRPYQAGSRQAQTIQTHRFALRKDSAELRFIRRARSRLYLDQIRPHGLASLSLS
jgi:hypothetical protein